VPPELDIRGADLNDKHVVLADGVEWSGLAVVHRVMLCTGGFGCSPSLGGNAVFARAVSRTWSNRYDRGCFERLATPDEVAEAEAFFKKHCFETVRKKAERGFSCLLDIQTRTGKRIRVLRHKKPPVRYRALCYSQQDFMWNVCDQHDARKSADDALVAAHTWQET